LLPDTTPMSLEQWLDRAEHTFAATARALGEEGVFTQARHILRVGTSAERQVRCFDSSHASALARRQAVVDLLLEESSAG
jgi:carboxylate-amine ligase